MLIPVTFFLALGAAVVSYAFGQGGPIAGLFFFGILFIGAVLHVTEPLREKLKP